MCQRHMDKSFVFYFQKAREAVLSQLNQELDERPIGKTLAQVQQSPSSCMTNKNTDGRFCVEMKFGTNSKSNPPIIH